MSAIIPVNDHPRTKAYPKVKLDRKQKEVSAKTSSIALIFRVCEPKVSRGVVVLGT
jgi:hypothetical protein